MKAGVCVCAHALCAMLKMERRALYTLGKSSPLNYIPGPWCFACLFEKGYNCEALMVTKPSKCLQGPNSVLINF